jgi:hypothetical protein
VRCHQHSHCLSNLVCVSGERHAASVEPSSSLRHVQRHTTRMVTRGHPASTKPPAVTVEPESLAVQKVSRNTAVPEIAFAVLKNWCSAACWPEQPDITRLAADPEVKRQLDSGTLALGKASGHLMGLQPPLDKKLLDRHCIIELTLLNCVRLR